MISLKKNVVFFLKIKKLKKIEKSKKIKKELENVF